MKKLSYQERSKLCSNHLTKKLFQIMEDKKTNLCVAIDYASTEEILNVAQIIGPFIAILKIHCDIIEDFNLDHFISSLVQLSVKHNFLIFEDRKFSDIGSTIQKQYQNGPFKISQWAHMVTAHPIAGPLSIQALKECQIDDDRGCLLVAQLSSKENLITDIYTKKVIEIAKSEKNFVIGFISQSKVIEDPTFVHLIPGVSIKDKNDNLGQQYISPEEAILERGADLIIVGRGISKACDKLTTVKLYQTKAYDSYLKILN